MSNNTTNTVGMLNGRVNGVGYFLGVSAGVIFLIAAIAFASYFCSRTLLSRSRLRRRFGDTSVLLEVGLDERTLKSYPTLQYSQAKLDNKETCCSICLSDYQNTDTLRQLPDCGHLFHLKCVDPWLRLHPSCPVCRKSPMPTPISTPLGEAHPQV